MANTEKRPRPINKRMIKEKLIKELESLYVSNPAMNSEIDSYNYGIHDSIKKIEKTL